MAETPDAVDLARQVCQVAITAPDADWLVSFARRLLDDRLIAAAHHTAAIRSVYRWGGEVYDRPEGRTVLHTRTAHVPTVLERINREHPYEVPGAVVMPIIGGNPEYLRWILDETGDELGRATGGRA